MSTKDELKSVLRMGREFFAMRVAEMKEVPEWAIKQRNILERDALLIDWKSLPQHHLCRWERVQELRAHFGKAKKVSAIWEIVAKETGTTAAAIDQSCKRIKRLRSRIERLNRELGIESGSYEIIPSDSI